MGLRTLRQYQRIDKMGNTSMRHLVVATLYYAVLTAQEKLDPADDQIELFRLRTPCPIGNLTTSAGKPVYYNETTTLNKRLLINDYFVDIIAHFNRERIPTRVVHAKGAGAFGYFEVTDDISGICKAKFLNQIGKKTSIAVRFSLLVQEEDGSDLSREPRGFSIKFYTEEGNLDLVGLNTEVFPFKDPILFPGFIHASKKNPATHLYDQNMSWDAMTLHPESLYQFLLLSSDGGIPKGYRHMPGYPIHTYQVVNEKGESHFVRFHFIPDAGLKNFSSEEASQIDNTYYATRDLYEAIAKGKYPSWTCYVQVLTTDDVKNADYDVFDVTRVISIQKHPLKRFGKLVLNRNPLNYFAEIEQISLCPSNLVPGVVGAPDKMFEARHFAYRDAQRYRLGANFMKIPVNCPMRSKARNNNRDGVPPVDSNGRDSPNYYPDSFHGLKPYKEKHGVDLLQIFEKAAYNIDLMRDFYRSLTQGKRQTLVENIVATLKLAVKFLRDRAVKQFTYIDPDLGKRVDAGLKANGTRD